MKSLLHSKLKMNHFDNFLRVELRRNRSLVLFILTTSKIGFYALTIKFLIGCEKFTVCVILHFFEALAFEQNVNSCGFAMCSNVVRSTRMWANGLGWHWLYFASTKRIIFLLRKGTSYQQ